MQGGRRETNPQFVRYEYLFFRFETGRNDPDDQTETTLDTLFPIGQRQRESHSANRFLEKQEQRALVHSTIDNNTAPAHQHREKRQTLDYT